MSTRLTCPGCGRILLLPADCMAETLSCPRCLALISNPQAVLDSSAVQTALPSAQPPAAALPTAVTQDRPWVRDVDVDVDVRQDTRRTSGCMIVLAVLGGLGLAYTLLGSAALANEGIFQPLLIVLGIVGLATVISLVRVYGSRPSQSTASNMGRTILNVLTVSGVLVVAWVLLCVAAVIFLFVICLSTGVRL